MEESQTKPTLEEIEKNYLGMDDPEEINRRIMEDIRNMPVPRPSKECLSLFHSFGISLDAGYGHALGQLARQMDLMTLPGPDRRD